MDAMIKAIRRKRHLRRWALTLFPCALLALIGAGCATTVPIPGADTNLLQFLLPGHTTRQDVVLRLGQPSATFEQETIFTYRLGQDPKQGYYVVGSARMISPQGEMAPTVNVSWGMARYSLVLVFDANGVLQTHSLVPVH